MKSLKKKGEKGEMNMERKVGIFNRFFEWIFLGYLEAGPTGWDDVGIPQLHHH